jgi:hypothetical protein
MPNRLIHDEAFLLARQLMALISHLLREEEHKDAFDELYHLSRAAIERYAEAEERMRKRLRPASGRISTRTGRPRAQDKDKGIER